MFRPSVFIPRLVGAAAAAAAMLVVSSSRAFALRPDPAGQGYPGGSRMPEPAASGSSATVLWIALAIAVVALALIAAVVARRRQRPFAQTGQSSATA